MILAPHDLKVLVTVMVVGSACAALTLAGRTLMPHDGSHHA
jgi:hypothetical protein